MTRVTARYENCSFDNFETDQNIDYLKEPRKLKNNVVISGDVGTGKTHLAYAILNQEEEKRVIMGTRIYSERFVVYTTVSELLEHIKASWKGDDYIEHFKEIPLLIIDEIGIQYGTQSERIELFDLFNTRYNEMLPTIIISNVGRKELDDLLGLRITDRLYSNAIELKLNGRSHR